MNPIPIFIPVVNRLDLLKKAIDSIPLSDDWQVEVINNTGSPLPYGICAGECNPSMPLTAAQTLNWMQHLARNHFDAPFYFFMHNDTEAGEGTIAKLFEMARSKEINGDKWGVIFTLYDTLAAFNTDAFEAVGPWDTTFTQYFVDNDMYRRLRLAGYELAESHLPVTHVGSQTIKSDEQLEFINSVTFHMYQGYYAKKWGGTPGNETYKTPFGR